MQRFKWLSKTQSSFHLLNIVLISSTVCVTYIIASALLLHNSNSPLNVYSSYQDAYASTGLEHIVFGIASNQKSWLKRKEYVKLWWEPCQMRGYTSRFRYTFKVGLRSAIRVARVVLETVALNHTNVRWYVFGDDDTVFFPQNLVKTLSKYDHLQLSTHRLWYYIGSGSEIYQQNKYFSFQMAFGGAGFAISYPLARVLAKVDSRVYSCLAELGVGLTREPGFHQFDVRGDAFGLLATHPLTPLVSLHHMDHVDPIFPNMTATKALEHLFHVVNVDSQRILQQTVCYDRWFSWTISISWGYAVQVYSKHMFLPEVLSVPETFKQWTPGGVLAGSYTFNTREFHPDPCQRPTTFLLDTVSSGRHGIMTVYKKSYENCTLDNGSPRKLGEIRVSTKKLDLNYKQMQAPRRQCCDVLPSKSGELLDIAIRECNEDELIHMHA
ncbi:hypothetical protein E1A91_D12G156100v1 [Gossypium mustelinum]|uniref:Uncharacterized protein n=1 Tax=Gossypium mustelinum TaxID=34275 RepID=A0A5D2SG48_GOSMU|nr:hypothetical protein E1A91_D12G156100v1 [Gossypium mustelinum]